MTVHDISSNDTVEKMHSHQVVSLVVMRILLHIMFVTSSQDLSKSSHLHVYSTIQQLMLIALYHQNILGILDQRQPLETPCN